MMLNTQVIANTILKLAFEEDVQVTPMKLQKLIYFVYKDFLQTTGHKLFNEEFETWKYGPVLSSVYYEFSSFGANPITKFARDANENVGIIDLKSDSDVTTSILKTWEMYNKYSGIELSKLTHIKDSAWSKAKENENRTLKDEDIANEPEYR